MRGFIKKSLSLSLLVILTSVLLSTKQMKEKPPDPSNPNLYQDSVAVVREPTHARLSINASYYDVCPSTGFPLNRITPVKISAKSWITKRLTNNPAELKYPRIAVSGNYVHVIFSEEDFIYYKRSEDGGGTWHGPQNINVSPDLHARPYSYAIAAEGQFVHVVMAWQFSPATKWHIWYRRNINYGKSGYWGGWMKLTSGLCQFMYPDIAIKGQYVHIVYQGCWPGNYEIFYKRISNYGVGSSITKRLTYSTTGFSMYPRVAAASQYVYVVYQDDWPGKDQIFLKRMSNWGAGAPTTLRLTHNLIYSEHPDITAQGEYVFVGFENYDSSLGRRDLFSKTLENYGAGSITTKRLTYTGLCFNPSIAFDTGTNNVQVAYNSFSPGNDEIFWKVVYNYGKGSYSTYRLTYSTSGWSRYPDMSINDSTTHIVYQDDWPGSKEIFYKIR